jgi:phosphate transport system substrate-binding protein
LSSILRQVQTLALVCIGTGFGLSAGAQDAAPVYNANHQVSGTIRIWGSPQMADLLRNYEDGFHQVQPSVHFEADLKSTITAVAGVYTERADIGLLGRGIWPIEVQAFESIKSHPPIVLDVATGSYDVPKATFALMIFVPRENPLASLSFEQLGRLFGATHPFRLWGELGLKGEWAPRPIHLYGFTAENDKSQIFSQLVFKQGERWSSAMHDFGNEGAVDAGQLIVNAVAHDPDGIAISNVHYAVPEVREIPLRSSSGAPIEPTKDNVRSRRYPLTRAVYMVVDRSPGHPLNEATAEFLRFVLSRQGQAAVAREGNYLPLTDAIAVRQLSALQSP